MYDAINLLVQFFNANDKGLPMQNIVNPLYQVHWHYWLWWNMVFLLFSGALVGKMWEQNKHSGYWYLEYNLLQNWTKWSKTRYKENPWKRLKDLCLHLFHCKKLKIHVHVELKENDTGILECILYLMPYKFDWKKPCNNWLLLIISILNKIKST